MIRIKHGTWALNGSTGKDSDEDSLDPDYMPEESMDSQSDPDSEDEYIEERARRARNRPVSPAKPGEDAMVPVTAVKQEPMGGDDPHRTLSSDAVAESRQPLRQEAPRRSSTTEDAELSDVGAVVRVSGWALVDQRAGEAPRWSSIIMEAAESSNAGSVVEVPSWASEIPVFGTAPRLEPESEPVVMTNQASERPDVIVVESADGVREEYIVKSEVDSSGEETGAPSGQQLSQGNAMVAAAAPIADSVVDSDSLFTKDELREAQQKDDGVRISTEFWQKGVPPDRAKIRAIPEDAKSLLLQFESLQVRDGILYRRFHHPDGTTKYWQLVLPVSLCCEYIQRIHTDLGHFGQTKTCEAFARCAYFPGWRPYVNLVVRNCTTCNKSQRSRQMPKQTALRPMREFRPMAVLHTDLVGPIPAGSNQKGQHGFQYILSVVDPATRYLWLIPLCNKTAETVANALYEDVIARTSVPSAILTDLGTEFTAEVLERLCAVSASLGFGLPVITLSVIVNVSEPTFQCIT